MSELIVIRVCMQMLCDRWRLQRDERGDVSEKVIIVAIFAALAIGAGAIIVAKVTAKAESIPTQ